MPLLDDCWCCSLQIAASVTSIYITVAYGIAFLMELWWVWDTGGKLPHLAYILILGYLVTFVISAISVKGITDREVSHLALWMLGILLMIIPEGGLVLFMSFQFWKIHTVYGLTEMTCWICRLIANAVGLICVYSLYLNWKEEKQVLTSLRDLNRASPPSAMNIGRRTSVVSLTNEKTPMPPQSVAYVNQGFQWPQEILPSNNFRRSVSLMNLGPVIPIHPPPPPVQFTNEFNASRFDSTLRASQRSRSMGELLNEVDGPQRTGNRAAGGSLRRQHQQQQNRRRRSVLMPAAGATATTTTPLGFFPTVGDDRIANGYFAGSPGGAGFLVDQRGKVELVQTALQPHVLVDSRISVDSDDLQKYRDVAL